MTDNSKLIQGSPEWHAARTGKITGSRFKDVLSKKDGVTRAKYMRELLLERKTGIAVGGYFDKNMANGQNVEPQARAYYERMYDVKVETVGFIDHPLEQYRGYVGVSPDGKVDCPRSMNFVNGVIEIKCPLPKNHLDYIAKNVMPSQYMAQVQGNMWVMGRRWCDFISFCPEVEKEPFWCIRVERDEAYSRKLAAAVDEFIQEMVEMQQNQVEVDPQLLIDVTEGGCSDLDWQIKLKDEIRGKVRMHVVCAYISAGKMIDRDGIPLNPKSNEYITNNINAWVDFIITGA